MILGRKKDDEFDLKAVISEVLSLAGTFNISDYVPFLAPFDLKGLAKRMKAISKSAEEILEKIISEHEKDKSDELHQNRHKDFVDVLLSMLNQPMDPNDEHGHIIDKTNIKATLLGMLGASIDTSSTVIDWTIAELLKHPRVMTCLKEELECVIGKKRVVEEKDLINLPYLDMVIKESLRLHPAIPLLIPHESMEDITIDGVFVPNKSRIIVNFWAIGRDLNVWSNSANEFFPERFIDSSLDVRGHDFQLIPFGSGRRGCPGIQLGLTTVKFVVAQLMHCFDWNLPEQMLPDEVDMSERFGLAVSRKKHMLARPTYRLHFCSHR
jgi:26-hydroxylase